MGKACGCTASPIAGTTDDFLYQSETRKFGGFTYEVPLANGTCVLEINVAGIYFEQPGARVFDVRVEDQILFNDLDIVVAAGGPDTALVLRTTVEVTDGALTLAGSPEPENPKISAFSIWTDDLIV